MAGTLMHISFVYTRGRHFLPIFIRWANSYLRIEDERTRAMARWKPPASVLTNLSWWFTALSYSHHRSFKLRPPTIDLDIWVDASTSWGVGILLKGKRAAWKVKEGSLMEKSGRDILWLEALAVEFVLRAIVLSGVNSSDVLVRSDNQAVISSFQKGYSHHVLLNESIGRCEHFLTLYDISLSFVYVESSINIADDISRGVFPPSFPPIYPSIDIPHEVAKYFSYVQ